MSRTWVDVVEKKAGVIHEQMAAARLLLNKEGHVVEGFERPYMDLLNQLYREEFPLAQLIDDSDLVARFEGRAISRGSAPSRVVAYAVSGLRNQIRIIARSIGGLTMDVPWPDSLDPLFTGLAKGSLVIGISIPSSRIEDDGEEGQRSLPAIPDPVLGAVRESVKRVAVVSRYIRDDHVDESIEEEIPDPAVRDTVLVAASKLAPTRQSKIEELVLYEPGMASGGSVPLTVESRKVLRKAVAQPIRVTDSGTFSGVVRAIDLDARRFEIRHVGEIGGGSIRCIYSKEALRNERYILGMEVRVHGRYERTDGAPRLVEVIDVEVVASVNPGVSLEGQHSLLTGGVEGETGKLE